MNDGPEQSTSTLNGFLCELRRRKVYRVAVACVVAAGSIIQLASATFPAWELPNWALRLVIILLLAGFPIALILAWVCRHPGRNPDDAEIEASRPTQQRQNITLLVIVGLLVSGSGRFIFVAARDGAEAGQMDRGSTLRKLSDDEENAYFVDDPGRSAL